VAMHLYEDLYDLSLSPKFVYRIKNGISVLNAQNRRRGVRARRGDGTLGAVVPHVTRIADPGFSISRGEIATIEIGVEVKVLMKAMIKQIDRVCGDLNKQVEQFKSRRGDPICIGIVGINHAPYCVSYEGDRVYRTDGKKHRHPADEATEAETRLRRDAEPAFDDFIVLRFVAHNEPPFDFSWVDERATIRDYGAALVRISQWYESRL